VSRDPEVLMNVYAYFEVHRHFSFLKYLILKCRFSVSVARQPALP